MATGGQGQPQQPADTPPKKPFKALRIILGVVGALLILAGAVLSILAATKIIADIWVSISAIGLIVIAALIALFTWLWPFSSENANHPQTPASPSPIHVSPTINVTFPATPTADSATTPTITPSQHAQSSPPSSPTISTTPAQTSMSHPSPSPTTTSIFHFNMPLQDPAHFYGRTFERIKLLTRMQHGAATAISGERRIGKTWLLRYIQLVTPHHPSLGPTYRVGYLSGSNAKC